MSDLSVYLWADTRPVSTNWHDEGGLLVVAESLEAARDLALNELLDVVGEYADGDPDWMTDDPSHWWPIENNDGDPTVIVMPNAGCC